jgi:hypothetical protein
MIAALVSRSSSPRSFTVVPARGCFVAFFSRPIATAERAVGIQVRFFLFLMLSFLSLFYF